MPDIYIDNISHAYSKNSEYQYVLRDISMYIEKNTFVSIVGPSGCGKTTLLKIIAGLLVPTEGEVIIDSCKVSDFILGKKNSFMFQNDNLLPWRNVYENISLPFELNNIKINRDKIYNLLNLVNLLDSKNKYPNELSGGMKSRVALARSLCLNPKLLLLDEPFGALDEETSNQLNLELYSICKNNKQTMVLVTHNIEHAVLLSKKIIILSKYPGRIYRELNVDLSDNRTDEIRYTNDYFELVKIVRKYLHECYSLF